MSVPEIQVDPIAVRHVKSGAASRAGRKYHRHDLLFFQVCTGRVAILKIP